MSSPPPLPSGSLLSTGAGDFPNVLSGPSAPQAAQTFQATKESLEARIEAASHALPHLRLQGALMKFGCLRLRALNFSATTLTSRLDYGKKQGKQWANKQKQPAFQNQNFLSFPQEITENLESIHSYHRQYFLGDGKCQENEEIAGKREKEILHAKEIMKQRENAFESACSVLQRLMDAQEEKQKVLIDDFLDSVKMTHNTLHELLPSLEGLPEDLDFDRRDDLLRQGAKTGEGEREEIKMKTQALFHHYNKVEHQAIKRMEFLQEKLVTLKNSLVSNRANEENLRREIEPVEEKVQQKGQELEQINKRIEELQNLAAPYEEISSSLSSVSLRLSSLNSSKPRDAGKKKIEKAEEAKRKSQKLKEKNDREEKKIQEEKEKRMADIEALASTQRDRLAQQENRQEAAKNAETAELLALSADLHGIEILSELLRQCFSRSAHSRVLRRVSAREEFSARLGASDEFLKALASYREFQNVQLKKNKMKNLFATSKTIMQLWNRGFSARRPPSPADENLPGKVEELGELIESLGLREEFHIEEINELVKAATKPQPEPEKRRKSSRKTRK